MVDETCTPPPFAIVPKYSPYSPIHLRPTYITEWQSRASIQCLILKGQIHLRVLFVHFLTLYQHI